MKVSREVVLLQSSFIFCCALTYSVSVAPMMDLTDKHCRAFLRLLSPNVMLYTEMVVVNSIIYGDQERFLSYNASEHPVALQLGGCDPKKLAICSQLAEQYGYDEVNLNVGCPSDRVKNAQFGACLMAQPELVADCIHAMSQAVTIPITVKTRLGIDNLDSYENLVKFIHQIKMAGCQHFIVHARKAWLQGLSPKENRTIPPLQYDMVYKLKADFPDLRIDINGGIKTTDEIQRQLKRVDGVMVGREIYQNPWLLREIEKMILGENSKKEEKSRFDIVMEYLSYIEAELAKGVYLRHMSRHMLGLFHKQPGAKLWRRFLSEHGPKKGAGSQVIQQALNLLRECHEMQREQAQNVVSVSRSLAQVGAQ